MFDDPPKRRFETPDLVTSWGNGGRQQWPLAIPFAQTNPVGVDFHSQRSTVITVSGCFCPVNRLFVGAAHTNAALTDPTSGCAAHRVASAYDAHDRPSQQAARLAGLQRIS
jgi:hypothetical protein